MNINDNSKLTKNFNHSKYLMAYYPEYNGAKTVYAVSKNDLPNHTKTVYQVYTLIEKSNGRPAVGIEDEFTVIKNKNNKNNNSMYSSQIMREKTIKTLSNKDEKEFRQTINKLKKTKNTKKKTSTKKKTTTKTRGRRRPRNSKKGGYVSNCGDPALAKYDCLKPQWQTNCI